MSISARLDLFLDSVPLTVTISPPECEDSPERRAYFVVGLGGAESADPSEGHVALYLTPEQARRLPAALMTAYARAVEEKTMVAVAVGGEREWRVR